MAAQENIERVELTPAQARRLEQKIMARQVAMQAVDDFYGYLAEEYELDLAGGNWSLRDGALVRPLPPQPDPPGA